jgi:hypothetical protein
MADNLQARLTDAGRTTIETYTSTMLGEVQRVREAGTVEQLFEAMADLEAAYERLSNASDSVADEAQE